MFFSITSAALAFNVYAEKRISGEIYFNDGTKHEFINLINIDIKFQEDSGKIIRNKNKNLSIYFKEKLIELKYDLLEEITIKDYDLSKTGDNNIYLRDGSLDIKTKNKFYKNIKFASFNDVKVSMIDEYSGEKLDTVYLSATLENLKPRLQIQKIIFNPIGQ